MYKLIFKIVIGILLGIVLFVYANSEMSLSLITLCVFLFWGIGIVYGFKVYLRWLSSAMQAAMQLSIISALSFGTGIIGFIVLICLAAAILAFGWVYGIYLLVRDIFGFA